MVYNRINAGKDMTVQQLIDRLNELPHDWRVFDRTGTEVEEVNIARGKNDPIYNLIDAVILDTSTSWC